MVGQIWRRRRLRSKTKEYSEERSRTQDMGASHRMWQLAQQIAIGAPPGLLQSPAGIGEVFCMSPCLPCRLAPFVPPVLAASAKRSRGRTVTGWPGSGGPRSYGKRD